jgi:hypothetical protein
LKLVKIETLRVIGGQDLIPKKLQIWMGLELELGKALQKKNSDLVDSGIHEKI